MNNSKAKGIGIGLLVGVLVLGLAGSLSYFTKGFTDWTFADISIPFISTDTSSSDDSSDSSSDPEPAGLVLNVSSIRLAAVGDTAVLTATVAPADATIKAVTWATEDSSKISIVSSQNTATGGTATIKAEQLFSGTVTITATTVDGGFSATCLVRSYVMVQSIEVEPIVSYPAQQGQPFLYSDGAQYYAKQDAGHEEEVVRVDLVVSPANAVAVSSAETFLSQPDWILSDNGSVSQGDPGNPAGTFLRGAIVYDEVEDTATLPLHFLVDFNSNNSSEITFELDSIPATIDINLFVPVTGVSVTPPTYNF